MSTKSLLKLRFDIDLRHSFPVFATVVTLPSLLILMMSPYIRPVNRSSPREAIDSGPIISLLSFKGSALSRILLVGDISFAGVSLHYCYFTIHSSVVHKYLRQ